VGNVDDYRIGVQRPEDAVVVVLVSGKIDVTDSLSFRDSLFALLDEKPTRLVIDLSSLAYVDTYALSALVDVAMRCRLEDRGMALVSSAGEMRRALAATGLDQFVPTHATLDEALRKDEPAS
jgi:anti-sigma B factor antagonist